jgi:hypothetical protein
MLPEQRQQMPLGSSANYLSWQRGIVRLQPWSKCWQREPPLPQSHRRPFTYRVLGGALQRNWRVVIVVVVVVAAVAVVVVVKGGQRW